MKRRRFLLGVPAASTSLAGCTYAPGGGDLRREERFPAPGDGRRGPLFGQYDDGPFLTARSGSQWIRDDGGNLTFAVATTATLVEQNGAVVWRYRRRDPAAAVEVGDRLFLLGDGELAPSPPIDAAATAVSPSAVTTGVDWTANGSPDTTTRQSWARHRPHEASGVVRPSGDSTSPIGRSRSRGRGRSSSSTAVERSSPSDPTEPLPGGVTSTPGRVRSRATIGASVSSWEHNSSMSSTAPCDGRRHCRTGVGSSR